MHLLLLVLVGTFVGMTTAVFGFGGGFVAVPVIAWADHAMGGNALRVATATSLVVMVGSALVATLATPRSVLSWLRHRPGLLACLAAGGLLGRVVSSDVPAGWVRWGFVAYITVTFLDLVARRGFITRRPARTDGDGDGDGGGDRALPAAAGLPIGAIATILGVGGSVMTVPALRRAGASMPVAAALANPLTLATATPHCCSPCPPRSRSIPTREAWSAPSTSPPQQPCYVAPSP